MLSRCLPLLLVIVVMTFPGCKSRPLGPYASPRVQGMVVDSQTGEPLAKVRIARGRDKYSSSGQMAKGGELLIRKIPVSTGRDGRFALGSERVLSIFRGAGWSEVRLTFSRADYFKLQTNYSIASATNQGDGGLLLDVGTVKLTPVR